MRIWETASREPLPITFNHCDFHAASPPGACRECPHPLPGQIRRGSWGGRIGWSRWFWGTWPWCAHPDVNPKEQKQAARKTQLRYAKRPRDWELGHHSFHSHLTWFRPPSNIRLLKVFQNVKKKKKKKSRLVLPKVPLRESLLKNKQKCRLSFSLCSTFRLVWSHPKQLFFLFCVVWSPPEIQHTFSLPTPAQKINSKGEEEELCVWRKVKLPGEEEGKKNPHTHIYKQYKTKAAVQSCKTCFSG